MSGCQKSNLRSVENLCKLLTEVHDTLKDLDKDDHSLMCDSKQEMVGFLRGLFFDSKLRWSKGKYWGYALHLMGCTIPFGENEIPHFGEFMKNLLNHVENGEKVFHEFDVVLYLVFGSVLNTRVS